MKRPVRAAPPLPVCYPTVGLGWRLLAGAAPLVLAGGLALADATVPPSGTPGKIKPCAVRPHLKGDMPPVQPPASPELGGKPMAPKPPPAPPPLPVVHPPLPGGPMNVEPPPPPPRLSGEPPRSDPPRGGNR